MLKKKDENEVDESSDKENEELQEDKPVLKKKRTIRSVINWPTLTKNLASNPKKQNNLDTIAEEANETDYLRKINEEDE